VRKSDKGFGNAPQPAKHFTPELRTMVDAEEQTMVTTFNGGMQIEDLGNHTPSSVAALRSLLTSGANAIADPKRNGFFEIESESIVYYIHVSPVTGKVLLLATWQNDAVEAAAGGLA
jgi:hypothetical protein